MYNRTVVSQRDVKLRTSYGGRCNYTLLRLYVALDGSTSKLLNTGQGNGFDSRIRLSRAANRVERRRYLGREKRHNLQSTRAQRD